MSNEASQDRKVAAMMWIWIGLAALFFLDALRLRGRASALAALPDDTDADDAPAGSALASPGVTVPPEVVAAARVHAGREELGVIDLVPRDLPTLRALALVSWIDIPKYRADRLRAGNTVGHAMFVTDDVRDRARVRDDELADARAFYRLAARLKRFACTATDFAVAPVPARPQSFAVRKAALQEAAGPFAPVVLLVQLATFATLAAGVAIPAVWPWGLVALAVFHLQPLLALAGTRLAPRDLPWITLFRLPVEIGAWLATVFAPRLEAADPVAERRPTYQALLAADPDTRFEPEQSSCPLCDSESLKTALRTRDLLQHKPGRFRVSKCRDCGHVFQNPRLSLDGLDFYYRDFYDGLGEAGADIAFGMSRDAYVDRARMGSRGASPSRWLDVGTGHGHFPCVASELLPETRFDGLDLSESVEEAERRGWIRSAHRGLFPDLADSIAGQYEVVSMHHYLEHTLDPRAEIAAAYTTLAPGGALVIEVPDPESPLRRIFGRYWAPWFQPQHLNFVSRGNLERLLREAGLEPVEWHVAKAHQPVDIAAATFLLLGRIAPPPDLPWRPAAGLGGRVWNKAVWSVGFPLLMMGLLADKLIAPLIRLAGVSNTYRVLAVKPDADEASRAA